MRHTFLLSITVLAAALVSCTQDEFADGTQFAEGKYPLELNANIGSPATRATADGIWDAGDIVRVQVINDYTDGQEIQWDTAKVLQYKVAEDRVTMEFSAGDYQPFWTNKKPKLVRAWWAEIHNGYYDRTPITKLPCTFSVSYRQDLYEDAYKYSDFVFAQKLATFNESIKNGVGLTFHHQVAKVVVNIYGQPLKAQNLKVSKLELNFVTYYNKHYTFTPPTLQEGDYGEWEKPTTGNSTSVAMKPATANTDVNFGSETGTQNADFTFEALVIPQTTNSSIYYPFAISASLESDDGYDDEWRYEFASPVTWEAGYVYTYNITLTPTGLKLSSISVNTSWDTTGTSDSGEVFL